MKKENACPKCQKRAKAFELFLNDGTPSCVICKELEVISQFMRKCAKSLQRSEEDLQKFDKELYKVA